MIYYDPEIDELMNRDIFDRDYYKLINFLRSCNIKYDIDFNPENNGFSDYKKICYLASQEISACSINENVIAFNFAWDYFLTGSDHGIKYFIIFYITTEDSLQTFKDKIERLIKLRIFL